MKEKRIGIEIRILANLICRCLNELGFNEEHNGLTGPQGLVQCLEGNGFVKRVSVDYDARLKKIVLTTKAHEFKELLESHIQKMEEILVKDLEPQEVDDLIRIIGKIKKNLE